MLRSQKTMYSTTNKQANYRNNSTEKQTLCSFISETLILWSLQISFSYLYILQRQQTWSVKSIFNCAITSSKCETVCIIPSQSWSLFCYFLQHGFLSETSQLNWSHLCLTENRQTNNIQDASVSNLQG